MSTTTQTTSGLKTYTWEDLSAFQKHPTTTLIVIHGKVTLISSSPPHTPAPRPFLSYFGEGVNLRKKGGFCWQREREIFCRLLFGWN